MADNKITVSWDDLNTRKVEARLKEQDALNRTREYSRMNESSLPAAAGPSRQSFIAAVWRNSLFSMSLFGLIGGLMAFVCYALMQPQAHDPAEASQMWENLKLVAEMHDRGAMPDAAYQVTYARMLESDRHDNPYFAVRADQNLSPEQREQKLHELGTHDRFKSIIANILSYGVSGVMIAVFLAIAGPITERNIAGAVVNGSVGAALGLAGGVIVSFFVGKLYLALGGGADGAIDNSRQMLARAVSWGTLGLFLSIAPGAVMRNPKKLFIGALGGLLGGVVGGLAFDPVLAYSNNPLYAYLVAMLAIGLFAGLATGIIENAAKTGWVKVVAGLIAGKQFILYRNPTFLGSGPDCQIYLFKDPQVGRRHAAIHIVPGGFELEDLPLGTSTLVNGKPVQRARLRNGDRIQIGSTALLFQEKTPAA
jgi:hypothetical protein